MGSMNDANRPDTCVYRKNLLGCWVMTSSVCFSAVKGAVLE